MTSISREKTETSRWYWVATVCYAGGITAASSLSTQSLPAGRLWNYDKLIHFVVYAGLGFLLGSALAPGPRGRRGRRAAFAIGLCAIFGVLDEWHQSFVPGRVSSMADVVADVAGAILGVLAAHGWFLWLSRRKEPQLPT